MRPWRASVGSHWTERARLLWPARQGVGLHVGLLPVVIIIWQLALLENPPHWAAAYAVSFTGAMLASHAMSREIFPVAERRDWRGELLGAMLLQYWTVAMIIIGVVFIPAEMNAAAWAGAAILVGLILWHACGGWLQLAAECGLATPAEAELHELVNRRAIQAGVEVRAVWILKGQMANAFALPITREVLFTERAVQTHPPEELAAITAHELGHFAESKGVLLLRVAGALWYLPLIFLSPLVHRFGFHGFLGVLVAGVGVVALMKRLSHRLEIKADQVACESAEDKINFARALERMHEVNQVPAVFPGRQTHPHLYDRMLAAGVTPDYPRPAEPANLYRVSVVYGGLIGAALFQLLIGKM